MEHLASLIVIENFKLSEPQKSVGIDVFDLLDYQGEKNESNLRATLE